MIVLLKRQDRIDYVIKKICQYYGISKDELCKRHRDPAKHQRKSLAVLAVYEIADVTQKEAFVAIGYSVVNRHGYQLIYETKEMLNDPKVKGEYDKLASFIQIL